MLKATQVKEDRPNGRSRVRTVNELPSKTLESQADQGDINVILQKYQQLGIRHFLRETDLQFRDVSEFEDYADMMRQSKIAEQEFMGLPAKVRALFNNNVHEWLDAAHSTTWIEENREQLEELGLVEKLPEPEPPPEPAPAE